MSKNTHNTTKDLIFPYMFAHTAAHNEAPHAKVPPFHHGFCIGTWQGSSELLVSALNALLRDVHF
jgi:hypothetical protein